jgi:DNA repair exonuclease SbcCD nuclease subunit
MRIAVLSDFHFGFGYNTTLEDDSFANAEEAMRKALGSDLILIAGDIFDTRYPKTPVWSRAIKILAKPLTAESSNVRFVSCTKDLKKVSRRTLGRIPIIALHGNHERRGRTTNTLEALENAGLLVHLHGDTIVFEKNGVRVAIHGMSWVPDRYAKQDLDEWAPKPLPDCVNIMMLHQSIHPYLYSPLEKPSIEASNLPQGFDLIIDGHLHGAGSESVLQTPLIFPGSTVITQFDKREANDEKGFYQIEINPEATARKLKFSFVPIENRRRFFFEDVPTKDGLRFNIEAKLRDLLARKFVKKPLIKLKIVGSEDEYVEQDIKEIGRKYGDRAILRFVKDLESPEITEKVEFLRNLRDQKLSAEEIGLNVLHKNLDELSFKSNFDADNIFSLLVDGSVDNAFNIVTGSQKTLGSFGGFNDNESTVEKLEVT